MTTTNSTDLLSTTYPYESTSPGVARHQCVECGGWERSDKNNGQIRHSKRCDSRPQPVAVVTAEVARVAELDRRAGLREFAANVRRTGLCKGRTEDLLQAVREGYLSESDAMNTDD